MKSLLLLLTVSLLFILPGCHTYLWQDVETDINGTWTKLPVEPGKEIQYTFDNGTLTITVNGSPIEFTDDDKVVYPGLSYRVDKKISNQYLIIQQLRNPSSIGRTEMFYGTNRWLVVKQKDNELYLMSEGESGLKGEYQLEFFR